MKNKKELMSLRKMFTKYKEIILFAILILLVVPICLYVLAFTPSSIGFMEPEDARAWLGYYGAIVGGGMTLWGVAWTMSNQRKYEKKRDDERKKDISNLYRPILCFEKSEIIEVIENKGDAYIIKLALYIKNSGRGEAYTTNYFISYFKIDPTFENKNILFPVNSNKVIRISTIVSKNKACFSEHFTLTISYSDVANIKFNTKIPLFFHYRKSEKNFTMSIQAE